jgi:FdhD protein
MTEATSRRNVVRYRDRPSPVDDQVVVEEPIEIRLDDVSIAVIMRTPGDEDELILGFLVTEGIVPGPDAISDIDDLGEGRWNVRLQEDHKVDPLRFKRNLYATSSCGVCGKASIDAIRVAGAYPPPGPIVSAETLLGLPDRFYGHQRHFQTTGGLHAAGAFLESGEIVAVREDIGRHNATDKLVGHLAAKEWPLGSMGLLVSGRVSFEIVQKAAVAGLSLVCGVSAASSLAVDVAEEFDMTIIGFLRMGGFTVYCGDHRVRWPAGHLT